MFEKKAAMIIGVIIIYILLLISFGPTINIALFLIFVGYALYKYN